MVQVQLVVIDPDLFRPSGGQPGSGTGLSLWRIIEGFFSPVESATSRASTTRTCVAVLAPGVSEWHAHQAPLQSPAG
jgi:hypothetical protein